MSETKKNKNFNLTEMKFKFNDLFTGIALLLCAFLCAFSLALIAIRLGPIAKWANYQTICVEQESLKSPIEWAVRNAMEGQKFIKLSDDNLIKVELRIFHHLDDHVFLKKQ